MNRHEFIDWFEDVRVGTRRLIAMVPEEAFDFRAHKDAPTIEQLMRSFASLEKVFVRGVCTGDWSEAGVKNEIVRRVLDIVAEDAGEPPLEDSEEELETSEQILEHLDQVHQEALDILAEVTEEEFQRRVVEVPWGERGTLVRLLLGMVEREVHHRTELYLALQQYGLPMHPMMLWGP